MRKIKYHYEDINPKVEIICDIDDIEPYFINLPQHPKHEFIGNFGLPKEQQFFQKERIPLKIWQINKALNNGEISREQAFAAVKKDSELQDFVASQWRKREEGDWQYVYGRAYYLTGTYWFFLNYYLMDLSGKVGTPYFRFTQWEKSLFWKYCVELNEAVYGSIEYTRRREGKSYWAANILLEYATRTIQAYCGIQSKSEDDAEALFKRAYLFQAKRLPFYFLPEHEKFNTKKLEFSSSDTETSFETVIDFKSTTATAYDGLKLARWHGNEFGKMEKPANPIDIWDKNKWCFFDDGKIIGKAAIESTVEEMVKGGGEQFHHLVRLSSRMMKDKMINEFGETRTGLVPYFTSSYKNMFTDQYGMPIIKDPLTYQANWRKLKGDRFWNIGGIEYVDKQIESAKSGSDRQDVIRKMPPTSKDAFRYNNTGCLFNIGIINDRLSFFRNGYPSTYPMTFGYFSWVPGKEWLESQFHITDEETAQCHIRMLPLPEMRNKGFIKNGKRHPANTARFHMGGDAFKMNTFQVARRDRASDGAGHVWAFLDPNIDPIGKPREMWFTNNFVLEYLYRAATPDLYAEHMAMIAIYYGCKIFPEANIGVVDTVFRAHELEEFLAHRWKPVQTGNFIQQKQDKKVAGAYTTESFMPTLIRQGINYIEESGAYCPFPRTLEQFRDLQWDSLPHNDAAASALYTLTGAFDRPAKRDDSNKKFDFGREMGIPNLTYVSRS